MKTFARYKNCLYDASFYSDDEIILRSFKETEGFTEKKSPSGIKIYIRHVKKSELQELYKERLYGKWHNVEFEIDGEDENEYTLWFTYHDYKKEAKKIALCESLGMEMYDRNVFYKSVPKSEISSIRTEKTDL